MSQFFDKLKPKTVRNEEKSAGIDEDDGIRACEKFRKCARILGGTAGIRVCEPESMGAGGIRLKPEWTFSRDAADQELRS
jgi:hypothetical protein